MNIVGAKAKIAPNISASRGRPPRDLKNGMFDPLRVSGSWLEYICGFEILAGLDMRAVFGILLNNPRHVDPQNAGRLPFSSRVLGRC